MKRSLVVLSIGCLMTWNTILSATELHIEGLTRGQTEMDLFSPETGAFIKELMADTITFPIPIIEDLGGEYLIDIEGQHFKVGSSSVITNNIIHTHIDATTACKTEIIRNPSASTRGLVNKGCR